jgi:glycerol-3-phosphate acyltransferase PlsY
MDAYIQPLALVAIAYALGSVPFGYLAGRFVRGVDIRKHGSGNIGATNVGRVLGGRLGMAVLLLDLLKGAIPVGLLAPWMIGKDATDLQHWQVAAGVATILGHVFPCWLRFRGGKGVATSLGVALCLNVWTTLGAAALYGASFAAFRIASVASMVGALGYAVIQFVLLWPNPFSGPNWSLAAFSLAVPALILARHRTNIVRLARGEEKKLQLAAEKAAAGSQPAESNPR